MTALDKICAFIAALMVLVLAGVLYVVWLGVALGYVRDVLVPPPAPWYDVQLPTLPQGAERLDSDR